jgi:hypothetical protein
MSSFYSAWEIPGWSFKRGLYLNERYTLKNRIISTLKERQKYGLVERVLLSPDTPLFLVAPFQDRYINGYAENLGFETLDDIKTRIFQK